MKEPRTARDIKWAAELPPSEARDQYLELLVDKHIRCQTEGGLVIRVARDDDEALPHSTSRRGAGGAGGPSPR